MKKILFLLVYVVPFLLCRQVSAQYFTNNNNGSITDNRTELIWQQGETGKKSWDQAMKYCKDLVLAGKTDWRLPSKPELTSLLVRSLFNPALDPEFFPGVAPDNYWSSSKGTASSGSAAWLVSFALSETRYLNRANSYHVRCVRGKMKTY